MSIEIVFPVGLWDELNRHLLRAPKDGSDHLVDEQMAFVIAGINRSDSRIRILAHEIHTAKPEHLFRQSPAAIAPRMEYVASMLARCRRDGWSLIEVHSHPFASGRGTTFSSIDWRNDRRTMPPTSGFLPDVAMYASMVIGQESLDAHVYERSTNSIVPVTNIYVLGRGANNRAITSIPTTSGFNGNYHAGSVEERHQRQELLFGGEGQRMLSRAAIAVVGLGGLGSFVALELAYLGIGRLVLIDPDCVEKSNLNRLMGAKSTDIGRKKVEVYRDLIGAIAPGTQIAAVDSSIASEEALNYAKDCDLLMGCVDNHGARLILNHLAIRYLLPLIDAGTGIRLSGVKRSFAMGGQVHVVIPGTGCLECRGFIDASKAAFELAPPDIRGYEREHGYGTQQVAPSVVFLNGVVASLQVAEIAYLLNLSELIPVIPLNIYDAIKRNVIAVSIKDYKACPTCGVDGVQGVGDLAPIHVPIASAGKPPPSIAR
ncbi:ThiF family adenylyltransferase [Nonomuraea sp. NPDC026600]|uniref:HesA/MoeB/ThiF family protein n=1 Tax=Nonomuraea sp. NPDC026600 TaxID=3155363 RepID=UPI0033C08EDF